MKTKPASQFKIRCHGGHGLQVPRLVCPECADLLVKEHRQMVEQIKEYPTVINSLLDAGVENRKRETKLTEGMQLILDATHEEYCEGKGPLGLPKFKGNSGDYHHYACQFVQDILYGKVPAEPAVAAGNEPTPSNGEQMEFAECKPTDQMGYPRLPS